MKVVMDTGCHAASLAVKSAKVDVVAGYPITPQTSVVEEISSMVEKGELNCKFLAVEGEHSVMAACAAASTAGARVFTATASQGLLYMVEVLHMVAGGRLPVVLANVNRAVMAPWSIWGDNQDSMSQRDCGWIQLHCSSVQEIYNTIIQAFKIAETVKIPTMVNFDGFILSHCMMPIAILDDDMVDRFLPDYEPTWRLDPANPTSFSNVTGADEYIHFRQALADDTLAAIPVIKQIAAEFKDITGMWDGDVYEAYRLEDAEYVVFSVGSIASETELAIDALRDMGVRVGALRLRLYRPFPSDDIAKALPENCKLFVIDRNFCFGMENGILYNDVNSVLKDRRPDVKVSGIIRGIGGIDVKWRDLISDIENLIAKSKEGSDR